MRTIPPGRINACRGYAAWALRSASIVLLTLGGVLLLARILFAIGIGQLSSLSAIYNEIREVGSPFAGMAMLLVGAGLGLFAERLARWMIPVPPQDCPRCGYSAGAEPRCPECGLDLSDPPERR